MYRFSKGYLFGFAAVSTLYVLPLVGFVPQVLLGLSLGVVIRRWYLNRRN